jgi:hypothetical protein
LSGVENKDLHREAKISSRHASILKQLAIALELFNKKSLEYQLLVWLCEQLQAAHLSGAKCIISVAFAPELQTIFNLCSVHFEFVVLRSTRLHVG